MLPFFKIILLILKALQEMKTLMEKWEIQRNLVVQDTEVWLDSTDVRNLLHVSNATIYRRRNEGAWVCKKVGGKWFYLKSSLF